MAIHVVEEKEGALTIKLDNGDLTALGQVKEGWRFRDKESVLRYALAVLVKALASGKKVFIEEDGKITALTPGDSLIEKPLAEKPNE